MTSTIATRQTATATQTTDAGGEPLRPANGGTKPTGCSPAGPLAARQMSPETHRSNADGSSLTVPRHGTAEIQSVSAGDGQGWLDLRTFAEMFNDAQQARIATSNRALRGGVDPDVYTDVLDHFKATEHQVELAMWRIYRRVVPPELIAWQKSERGVGVHLLARLLGHLGDPYIATPAFWATEAPEGHVCDPLRCGDGSKRHMILGEPFVRSISQLWAYCGYGDPTRKPAKGMTAVDAMAMGNPTCKMVLHLLALATMKQKANPGRYRLVYDERRLMTAGRVHAVECRRCGPSGKPAQIGSPWSNGHALADALRIVCKEMLRDMWLVRHAVETGASS